MQCQNCFLMSWKCNTALWFLTMVCLHYFWSNVLPQSQPTNICNYTVQLDIVNCMCWSHVLQHIIYCLKKYCFIPKNINLKSLLVYSIFLLMTLCNASAWYCFTKYKICSFIIYIQFLKCMHNESERQKLYYNRSDIFSLQGHIRVYRAWKCWEW